MKKKVIILACVLAAVLGVSAFVIFRIPAKPKYTKGNTEISERIENIRIECGSGRFTVISSDKNKIEVKETGNTDKSDSTLNWAVTGKTLRILCNSKKDSEYLLTIPGSYVVDDLDIEGKSVSADISDITARDMTLRSDEGIITIQRCKCIDAFIGEYVSGNVSLYNTFARRFDIKSGAADIRFVSPSFQRKCNVSTKTGDIEIVAPSDTKYFINEYHGKGSFKSDFESDKTGVKLNLKTSEGKIQLTNAGNKGKEIANEVNVAPPEVSTAVPKPTVKVPPTTRAPESKTDKAVKDETSAAEKDKKEKDKAKETTTETAETKDEKASAKAGETKTEKTTSAKPSETKAAEKTAAEPAETKAEKTQNTTAA